jgi:hypothetical protein
VSGAVEMCNHKSGRNSHPKGQENIMRAFCSLRCAALLDAVHHNGPWRCHALKMVSRAFLASNTPNLHEEADEIHLSESSDVREREKQDGSCDTSPGR